MWQTKSTTTKVTKKPTKFAKNTKLCYTLGVFDTALVTNFFNICISKFFMSIFTKIISICVLGISVLSFASVNSFAQARSSDFNYKIVTAKNGVNVRDSNCKIIDFAPFGTQIAVYKKSTSISCKVGNKNYKMVESFSEGPGGGYLASDFVSEILVNYGLVNDYYQVNSTTGLTLYPFRK